MKYYFETLDSEFCLNKEGIKDIMRFKEVTTMTVFKAVKCKSIDMMYCTEAGDIGEKGNCGRECSWYKPRNGISGNCKFNRSNLWEHGDEITIKL